MFSLTFNEQVHAVLPESDPFTSDGPTLRAAVLNVISTRGRTALHDGIVGGLHYLTRGTRDRPVLIVIGDGGDNSSAVTFEDVLEQIRGSNALIYTIAIVDPLDREAKPRRLRQFAEATGGRAFEPRTIDEMPRILRRIALDIRNMYTLGYMPESRVDRLRGIRVTVDAPDYRGLKVRARHGYISV